MSKKARRSIILFGSMGAAGLAAAMALIALNSTIVYFFSPTELAAQTLSEDQVLRIGGLVEDGSIVHSEGAQVTFRVTDLAATVAVSYVGALPDLFREGQGVIAQGRMGADGVFRAEQILAKHDENYMPREVAEALKASGRWKEGDDGAAATSSEDGSY